MYMKQCSRPAPTQNTLSNVSRFLHSPQQQRQRYAAAAFLVVLHITTTGKPFVYLGGVIFTFEV